MGLPGVSLDSMLVIFLAPTELAKYPREPHVKLPNDFYALETHDYRMECLYGDWLQ